MATKRANIAKAIQRLTSWSYSRYTDYDQCPLKCKLKHIDHIREPDNEHTRRGSLVHKLAEQFTVGQLRAFPMELGKLFKPKFMELRTLKALCEKQWAFTKLWDPTTWFGDSTWCRVKMDAHHLSTTKVKTLRTTEVNVIDHKTGREHSEHSEQRSLYAVSAFKMYPDAKVVNASHWYLDSKATDVEKAVQTETFKASQLPTLIKEWEQRTRAMLNDTRFAPRPSNACRWCHFRKENGGPCQY